MCACSSGSCGGRQDNQETKAHARECRAQTSGRESINATVVTSRLIRRYRTQDGPTLRHHAWPGLKWLMAIDAHGGQIVNTVGAEDLFFFFPKRFQRQRRCQVAFTCCVDV